ncbi:hypothetical protein F0Z19_3804 [Vibrio cyclitrophicus]|nr:hypothetical protein F0Z19_3804 [Vibrio cyclitrophicus]
MSSRLLSKIELTTTFTMYTITATTIVLLSLTWVS